MRFRLALELDATKCLRCSKRTTERAITQRVAPLTSPILCHGGSSAEASGAVKLCAAASETGYSVSRLAGSGHAAKATRITPPNGLDPATWRPKRLSGQ